jgi:pentatricopeptide repeat protein
VLEKCRDLNKEEKLFGEMLERGVKPDNVMFFNLPIVNPDNLMLFYPSHCVNPGTPCLITSFGSHFS